MRGIVRKVRKVLNIKPDKTDMTVMSDAIIETTKLSDKGQVVIPKDVRDRLGLKNGSRLLVIATSDAIILQKVELVGERMRLRELIERARTLAGRITTR